MNGGQIRIGTGDITEEEPHDVEVAVLGGKEEGRSAVGVRAVDVRNCIDGGVPSVAAQESHALEMAVCVRQRVVRVSVKR